MSDNKIVSLADMRKRVKQEADRKVDLKAELDYRTNKFLEICDEHQKRIQSLEANLRTLVRILKNLTKSAGGPSEKVTRS